MLEVVLLLFEEFSLLFLLFKTESRGILLVVELVTAIGFKLGDCVGVESGVSRGDVMLNTAAGLCTESIIPSGRPKKLVDVLNVGEFGLDFLL